MKNKMIFILALVANTAPLGLCFFYRGGAMLQYPAFAIIHILLFMLNNAAVQRSWQAILLGLIHIAVTFCTHQQMGWLYLHYVCDDNVGRAIVSFGTWVGTVWAGILSVASLIILARKQKHPKQQSDQVL